MMPLFFFVVAVVLFAAACSTPPPCADGTCELMSLDEITPAAQVIHEFYGTHAPLPTLVVYEKGNCYAIVPASTVTPGATGNVKIPYGKIMLPDGSCVFGTWYPDSNTIYMTKLDWQNTLAHELLHQRLGELYGDFDYDHVRAEWKTWLPRAVAMIK